MTTKPESVAAGLPARNCPRIDEFRVEDGEPEYYILVEQKVLCSLSTFCSQFLFGLLAITILIWNTTSM